MRSNPYLDLDSVCFGRSRIEIPPTKMSRINRDSPRFVSSGETTVDMIIEKNND